MKQYRVIKPSYFKNPLLKPLTLIIFPTREEAERFIVFTNWIIIEETTKEKAK